MKKVMAVYDPDPFYAERLSDYVNRKEEGMFRAAAFTSKEKLEEYAASHTIDILLIGRDTREEEFSGDVYGRIVYLSEERLTEGDEAKKIYKYQSGDDILREVMACYCEETEAEAVYLSSGENNRQIFGIYSPIGRCGKTSFALAISQLIAKEERVLFATLDEFTGFTSLMGEKWQRDLSDLFYYYKQGRFNVIRLNSLVYFAGDLAYLPPMRYPEDYCMISTEEIAGMFHQIAREGNFSTLVLDIGSYGKQVFPLLKICNIIYMPVKEDMVSQAKLSEFEQCLEEDIDAQKAGIKRRIRKIHVPVTTGMRRMDRFPQELLWGDLGDFVRSMMKGQKGLWEEKIED